MDTGHPVPDMIPEIDWTEDERLQILELYGVLDTPPEQDFDDLVRLAADLFDVEVAAVNLIDRDRQWFKAEVGLGVRESPIDNSVCALTLWSPGEFIVPDLATDERISCAPLVVAGGTLHFYARELLTTPEGVPIGTFCIADTRPRPEGLTEKQVFALRTLARQAMSRLELRRAVAERDIALVDQRANAAFNRQIIDSATDYAIIATDLNGRVIRWNAGAETVLGWRERDMLGHTIERIWPPDDGVASIRPGLDARWDDRQRWLMRQDGRRFWATGSQTPLLTEAGDAIGYVTVIRDRTEQKETEAALTAASGRYRGLFDSIDEGFCIIEMIFDGGHAVDYRFLEVNAAFERQTGLTGAAGQTMTALAPDHEAHWFDIYGEVALTGEPARFENEAGALGGRWFDVYAFRVDAPALGRVAVLFHDLTEVQKARLSLARSHEELEALVRERTIDLATALDQLREEGAEKAAMEDQLRQSQKMEAVGQLTGGLAHDFNNLLTGISGALELLNTRLDQGRFTDLGRYIQAAQGAAKRAAALTHRLLAFTRQQTLDARPTDIDALIDGMGDLIPRTVGPSVRFELLRTGEVWPTVVDRNQLENALLNLCINARDAMPDGGRITIVTAKITLDRTEARDLHLAAGDYARISVIDTGTGMDPETASKAFDPFFTTKPIGQGTGLGLSMIYGFVRQSGGQVQIETKLGEGTAMRIYLPRHLGPVDRPAAPASLSAAPRAAGGETVLIVDDEPTVRILATEVLEELGYTVIEAADGNSGLAVLQSNARIDLLVSDVGLPGGMNGRQMAEIARSSRPDLDILFITGYAESTVVGNGDLPAGMHIMTKPFTMDQLAARIRELIADRQPAAG